MRIPKRKSAMHVSKSRMLPTPHPTATLPGSRVQSVVRMISECIDAWYPFVKYLHQNPPHRAFLTSFNGDPEHSQSKSARRFSLTDLFAALPATAAVAASQGIIICQSSPPRPPPFYSPKPQTNTRQAQSNSPIPILHIS